MNLSNEQDDGWLKYYKDQTGRPPRAIMNKAISCCAEADGITPRRAADLGCGEGTETLALLRLGWHVLAIDQKPEAIALLEEKVDPEHRALLATRVAIMETFDLPPLDLFLACFSLPFCRPAYFPALWETVKKSLVPGGIFAGQLFGLRDSWASNHQMTFHAREGIEELLGSFDVIELREEEEDGHASSGPKHWHLFHVVARKKL